MTPDLADLKAKAEAATPDWADVRAWNTLKSLRPKDELVAVFAKALRTERAASRKAALEEAAEIIHDMVSWWDADVFTFVNELDRKFTELAEEKDNDPA